MRPAPLLFCLSAALLLFIPSCVDPMWDGGHGRGRHFQTFNTLPQGFVGPAYFYDGVYYAGGRYQTGRYRHGGQIYRDRYYHGGRYLYGGRYQQFPGPSIHSRTSVRGPTLLRSPRFHGRNHLLAPPMMRRF